MKNHSSAIIIVYSINRTKEKSNEVYLLMLAKKPVSM